MEWLSPPDGEYMNEWGNTACTKPPYRMEWEDRETLFFYFTSIVCFICIICVHSIHVNVYPKPAMPFCLTLYIYICMYMHAIIPAWRWRRRRNTRGNKIKQENKRGREKERRKRSAMLCTMFNTYTQTQLTFIGMGLIKSFWFRTVLFESEPVLRALHSRDCGCTRPIHRMYGEMKRFSIKPHL